MKSEDIAKLAGVSRSTVSRVINNYTNVPEATREKVMKVIDEYNYRPNTFARTLAGKKSKTIGLFFVILDTKGDNFKITRNDYFSFYLNYMVDVANSMDYYVLVNTVTVPEDYEKVNQAFLEKRIDGGVIIGTTTDTLEYIDVTNLNAPLVLMDYEHETIKGEDNKESLYVINSSDKHGIIRAVEYLIDKGHTKIGFIKGKSSTRSGRIRFEGFVEAMRKYGLGINEDHVIEGEFLKEVVHKNIREAVDKGNLPTAFISSNDYMGLEVMHVLNEEGYKVPEDIAIIGFDDVNLSERSNPPLTTIAPKYDAMSRCAIELLDQALKEEKTAEHVCEFDVDMILRDSC